RGRERVHALDGVDLPRDAAEDGRGVAGSRPDVEDALTAGEPERVDSQRDDVRLRDRLPFADGQRRVLVRELAELGRNELLTRHAAKGVENGSVRDVSPAQM